jgi:unsaturated rhamnogalacturonyl hydrolase
MDLMSSVAGIGQTKAQAMKAVAALAVTILASALATGEEPAAVALRVTNTLDAARPGETVEVTAAALSGRIAGGDVGRLAVVDRRTAHELLAQAVDQDGDGVPDRLVFQADFGPRESLEFALALGRPRKPRLEDYRVYARFVRERQDDFAWENDRVAFRVYGEALETFAKEPLTSSAVDAWVKRTRRLVLNDWYLVDDYHRDHGEGGDFYPAGRTRGCGGSGLMVEGALAVSKNFRSSRILATGPLRAVFELTYPEWEEPGPKVVEVKRVTLDAGSHFSRFESFYTLDGQGPVTWATGIRKADGVVPRADRERGVVRSWEHLTRYGENGWLGCAVVVDPAAVVDVAEAGGSQLLVAQTPRSGPATWWAGSGWDGSGDFPDEAAWDRHVNAFVARLRSPLAVEVLPR